MVKFVVNSGQSGQRIDILLGLLEPKQSRAWWQKEIKSGQVTLNGSPTQPKTIIKTGNIVQYLSPPTPQRSIGQMFFRDGAATLEILYENDSVIVINKPAGLITHPAHANTADSVVHRLLAYNSSLKQAVYDSTNPISLMRPGIVHRLDKDTSGVMIVAKTSAALHFLAKQIQEHQAIKVYRALLYGWLEENDLTVENYLGRDQNDRRKMSIAPPTSGRMATTLITLISRMISGKGDEVSYIEARPITGRTHQIRVHTAHIGHPILGDTTYGSHESIKLSVRLGLKRQFLHAWQLTVLLPNQTKPTTFTANPPPDLTRVLEQFSLLI